MQIGQFQRSAPDMVIGLLIVDDWQQLQVNQRFPASQRRDSSSAEVDGKAICNLDSPQAGNPRTIVRDQIEDLGEYVVLSTQRFILEGQNQYRTRR